eukprot:TRINITY_DN67440_c0_g1_i1.p3 TRINITY_DN67440_c0_g1~~TRINITY_DN67440_c0_g1_i1.p3  ORF type:complete len:110 (-),score=26.00 TRINITY_DN67440_c0_g1_i1:58-387(-)
MAPKQGEEFEVALGGETSMVGERPPKWYLGAYMLPREHGLEVSRIYKTGAFADWNERNAEREVMNGDVIVQVKSVKGNGKVIKEELYKRQGPAILRVLAGAGHASRESD